MTDHLEVWRPSGRELVVLAGGRLTIGKDVGNDLVLAHDRTVSRWHALLESLGAAWTVRDLGSRNGTHVNGELLRGERVLRHGDELRLGTSRLVYRADAAARAHVDDRTEASEPAPALTRREREVLLALCRPLFEGDPFPRPSSTEQVAEKLGVGPAAVKQHLFRLYGKFDIDGEGERRARLANEAIRRGAVSLGELRPPP